MARAVNVDITLDDFQRISDKTPFLADLKPSGICPTYYTKIRGGHVFVSFQFGCCDIEYIGTVHHPSVTFLFL